MINGQWSNGQLLGGRPESQSFRDSRTEEIVTADFEELSPRLLEPGVWLLRGEGDRWARHILQTLAMRLETIPIASSCKMVVRSVADPRDLAVFPHREDEVNEIGAIETIVRRHHLDA